MRFLSGTVPGVLRLHGKGTDNSPAVTQADSRKKPHVLCVSRWLGQLAYVSIPLTKESEPELQVRFDYLKSFSLIYHKAQKPFFLCKLPSGTIPGVIPGEDMRPSQQ
jgi:hypothetical protein